MRPWSDFLGGVSLNGQFAFLSASAAVGVLPPPRAVDTLRTTPGHIRAWFGTRTVDGERAGAILVTLFLPLREIVP